MLRTDFGSKKKTHRRRRAHGSQCCQMHITEFPRTTATFCRSTSSTCFLAAGKTCLAAETPTFDFSRFGRSTKPCNRVHFGTHTTYLRNIRPLRKHFDNNNESAESAGVDGRCVTAQMPSQAPAVPPQKEKGLSQQQNNIHTMGVAESGSILCRTTLNQVGDRSQ